MISTHTILPSVVFLLSLLCSTIVDAVNSKTIKDEATDCLERVQRGGCRTDQETMMKECRKSCTDWVRSLEKYEYFHLSEDDESFYDLSAKTVHGDTLEFERFDGYVTMVVNMAKLCAGDMRDPEGYFATIEDLHRVWPYSLQIVVFPFQNPRKIYSPEECADFDKAATRAGRPIHVMENAVLNDVGGGEGEETHPVYRYLKRMAEMEVMDVNLATFFIVNPEGTRVEVHQGTSLTNLKRYIHRMFETEL